MTPSICSPPLADVSQGAASQDPATAAAVRPVLSARTGGELTRLLRRLETGPAVHGVSVHRKLLDRESVARLARHVELVMTWPVNDLALLDRMIDLGVSGIISDEPAVLAELLAS